MQETNELESNNNPHDSQNIELDEEQMGVKMQCDLENVSDQSHESMKHDKSTYVGTGFTFDLTEFIGFSKKVQLQPGEDVRSILQEIAGEGLAWIILFYSLLNTSFITCWILSSKINKYLALTWRFIFVFFLMIPFVLYERRTIQTQNLYKYQISHIFNADRLKKMYLYSMSAALWYGVILTCAEWTNISQALYLGSLINFFLSLLRHFKGNVHKYELGGQATVILGIIFILLDTWLVDGEPISPQFSGKKFASYISNSKGIRVGAEIIALLTSLALSKITTITAGTPSIFPPYLSMMILNAMNAINMVGIGYFFNGVTFDFTPKWGFFSVITDYEFAIFLYGCLVLCLGLLISFALISRMFPNFVVPSIAYFFEPGISALLLNFTNVQPLPGWFSIVGYVTMIPGMILIQVGHWLNLRKKQKESLISNTDLQLQDMDTKNPVRSSIQLEQQK